MSVGTSKAGREGAAVFVTPVGRDDDAAGARFVVFDGLADCAGALTGRGGLKAGPLRVVATFGGIFERTNGYVLCRWRFQLTQGKVELKWGPRCGPR